MRERERGAGISAPVAYGAELAAAERGVVHAGTTRADPRSPRTPSHPAQRAGGQRQVHPAQPHSRQRRTRSTRATHTRPASRHTPTHPAQPGGCEGRLHPTGATRPRPPRPHPTQRASHQRRFHPTGAARTHPRSPRTRAHPHLHPPAPTPLNEPAAKGDCSPQGPPAPDNSTRTSGAGGYNEDDGGAEAKRVEGLLLGLAAGDAAGWPAARHRAARMPEWTRRLTRELDTFAEQNATTTLPVPIALNQPPSPYAWAPPTTPNGRPSPQKPY